jgi:hypothetical protein
VTQGDRVPSGPVAAQADAVLGAADDRHDDHRQVRPHADLVVGEIRRLAG